MVSDFVGFLEIYAVTLNFFRFSLKNFFRLLLSSNQDLNMIYFKFNGDFNLDFHIKSRRSLDQRTIRL